MNQSYETLLSILGEGGALTISRSIDTDYPIYIYHHNEIGWGVADDIDETNHFRSFIEAFAQIDSRYPWHWLWPDVIHPDYHNLMRAALVDILNRRREKKEKSSRLDQYEQLLGIRLATDSTGRWTYELA